MSKDILTEIVEKRKIDISNRGWNFGYEIPDSRTRKIHKFLNTKGVILEVKRASPSKGNIAPDLNSAETARSYAEAEAKAVSCLTEENYFKGTLEDLKKVCAAIDKYEEETGNEGPAVLRKDFLIDEKEIEIAYNCGADAVLLISRILDTPKMISMAKKCEELGITALIELRLDEDVEKLSEVVKNVNPEFIACGVNSRDLSDFTIDLLKPVTMLKKIQKVLGPDARVIFESGIRTPVAAGFVGSLGFAGLLLGEAAAKNPSIRKDLVSSFTNAEQTENSLFWKKYSELISNKKLPLKKVCGLTTAEDSLFSAELNADLLGFIFWDKSSRKSSKECVIEFNKNLNNKKNTPIRVGVIVDPDLPESKTAFELLKESQLDVIQLHTMDCARKFLSNPELRKLPHYVAVNISCEEDVKNLDELFAEYCEPRVLVDAITQDKIGGTGKQISEELLNLVQKKYKLWIAGGVTPENTESIIQKFSPELLDCASGTECCAGHKDKAKLEKYLKA